MYIPVTTDFNQIPYVIPNIQANGGFNAYASKEVLKRLKKLLGIAFYNEFIAGYVEQWDATVTYALDGKAASGNDVYKSLQADNTNHPLTDGAWWVLLEADNKYLQLANGASYSFNNEDYEWEGLKEMFIPYVYSIWMDSTSLSVTGTGTVESTNENAESVNPINLIVNAWNDFARRAGSGTIITNSLYGFMFVNEDNYTAKIVFTDPGRKNFLGL